MFAPAPRSHFIPRTYTAQHHPTQTTVKRANATTNKENALPTKTPSRAGPSNGPLKAVNTGLRAGLGGKTVDRDRNVLKAPQEHMDDIGQWLYFSKWPQLTSRSKEIVPIHLQACLVAQTIQVSHVLTAASASDQDSWPETSSTTCGSATGTSDACTCTRSGRAFARTTAFCHENAAAVEIVGHTC